MTEAQGPPKETAVRAQKTRPRPADRPQLSPHRLLGPCLQLVSVVAARSVRVWDGPQGWSPSPTAPKRDTQMIAKAAVRREIP